ncbi:hypothetical protein HJC23_000069 [Cyclotella cryptica]|uniref:Uncharacterized protein n=1 Tax=Cyclotella cryptica TaxID=29204 RepID=A0ABD3PJN5_9STRA|eukprot:CCRYP_014384-RA/>CCRYP_014384-RA protein AED:0.00 eAED:0.00 QI:118/-1/1/1/-1/1/1/167/709
MTAASTLPSKLTSDLVANAFSTATLTLIDTRSQSRPPTAAATQPPSSQRLHKTSAYYRDSSGRALVHIRTRLELPGDDDGLGMTSLLQCGCIQPSPVDIVEKAESATGEAGESNSERPSKGDDDDVGVNELLTIGEEIGGSTSPWVIDTSFSFECSVAPSSNGRSKMWAVERVSILGSQMERRSNTDVKSPVVALLFNVEVAVRGNGIVKEGVREALEMGELELRAVLSQRENRRGADDKTSPSISNDGKNTSAAYALMKRSGDAELTAGLLGLELGGGALSPKTATARALHLAGAMNSSPGTITAPTNPIEMHYGTKIIRTTPPLRIQVTLIPPLKLNVREVCGARAASGSTLVEITVEHSSEWHREDVTVTGIAFHPGQSRLWEEEKDNDNETASNAVKLSLGGKSMQGGELSVIDMSRRARWGFCPGTAPDLPLVLGPYDAFATVIQIDAGEDVKSRAFLSPVSVNAMVGSNDAVFKCERAKENKEGIAESKKRVMVSTDVRWTTSRVAVENTDAFKVDMSLQGGLNTVCRVGAPLIVSLRVLNLSMEPRDLMLLMAKDGEGRKNELQWERPLEKRRARGRQASELSINVRRGTMLHNRAPILLKENQMFSTAVVSEVNGYTFGVWGLSGDDDGTTRHHRDHELLAVDAALLLGEVKGQHSIEAELRFVPLREGTLDVPNLKLYDKRGGRWYNCVHTLKIVAAAKV